MSVPPILSRKRHSAPSVFTPENLLREARRQKQLDASTVPEICVLDPDGDIVRLLRRLGRANACPGWACYHTDLQTFRGQEQEQEQEYGIVGCAVGGAVWVLLPAKAV